MDEPSSETVQKIPARLGFFLGVIAVIAVGAYFVSNFTGEEASPAPITPEGNIFLSLRTDQQDYIQSLLTFDTQTQQLFSVNTINEQNVITASQHLSSDGLRSVYTSAQLLPIEGGLLIPDASQIAVFNSIGKSKTILTQSQTYKTGPEWSPQGDKIAFMERDFTTDDTSTDAESWGVSVIDVSGTEMFLTSGMRPQWLPDNEHLLIVKNDGFYIYNIARNRGSKVWDFDTTPASHNIHVDLARDGSHLVWSVPNLGIVNIMEIYSLLPFDGVIENTINTDAFSVLFSEDAQYVALFEIDVATDISNLNPRITIYDRQTLANKTVIDLSEYDSELVFLTDWRN